MWYHACHRLPPPLHLLPCAGDEPLQVEFRQAAPGGQGQAAAAAAAAAAPAAKPGRCCAACGAGGAGGAAPRACSGCHAVRYCSRDCQLADW